MTEKLHPTAHHQEQRTHHLARLANQFASFKRTNRYRFANCLILLSKTTKNLCNIPTLDIHIPLPTCGQSNNRWEDFFVTS
jgi:hypothetical protein